MNIEKINVAVFCGSRSGNNIAFENEANKLGILLAQNNFNIIYGGGGVGIMGAVANSAMANNGEVIGVIPQLLVDWEQGNKNITELKVVADMHTRKKMLYDLSSHAIILPGGYGTMDELFEILTWNNLKIHNKKVFVLNTAGFYNHLLLFIINMQQQGFLYADWQQNIFVCDTSDQLLEMLLA
jgi:uncharacterized protein (TIGR00730 family)